MDYLIAMFYVFMGCLGGSGHYLKKRYYEEAITCGFKDYLMQEKKATLHTLVGILFVEIGLSVAHVTGWHFPLSDLVAAVTAGYTMDSGLNKAPKNV